MNIFKYKDNFNLKDLIINILIPLIGGGLLYINMNHSDLYNSLKHPYFTPTSIVFQTMWIVLYIFMGLAAYRITLALNNSKVKKGELFFYYIQLLLNYLWIFIFFSFRLYGMAFIELLVLIIFLIITIIKFFMLDKVSGLLISPYLIWVLYVSYLNCGIWLLNEA